MNISLTFIIPIRHPSNIHDPEVSKLYLQKTLASISAQTTDSWQCIIVANQGTELPIIPAKCKVNYVDFPPNSKHDKTNNSLEEFYDAVRIDKGKRVLSGMLSVSDTEYFMVVDDDDYVHRGLCEFVSANTGHNGWCFKDGYVWGDGNFLLFRHSDFNHICGTSHIIRRDLLNLPKDLKSADINHTKSMLGSHYYIEDILAQKKTPLTALPFEGAIYRVANVNSHSQSAGILKKYIFKKALLKDPIRFLRTFFSLRILTKKIKFTFWGIN